MDSEKMHSDKCTISRGSLCCKVQEQWTEIKKFAEKNDLDELKTFVIGLKDSGNYSGIFFTNTFRVNCSIGLTGLGFFGPHEVETTTYDVSIEIQRLSSNQVLFSTAFYRVRAEKGNIFHVTFDNPFIIEPYTFYVIKFQLDGPITGICNPKTIKDKCFGCDHHGRKIEFEFLNGSLQMPEISYVLF